MLPGLENRSLEELGLTDQAGLINLVRGVKGLGPSAELLRRLREYAIFSPATMVLRGLQPDSPQREPVGLSGGRLPEAVAEILDLENNRLGTMMPVRALYVLFMLVLALHPKAPLFCAIDNFDQAMHPLLVQKLTRLFCREVLNSESKRQILLTTHNPLALDGLNLRHDSIRLFAVERNLYTGGETRVRRVVVSQDLVADAKEKGYTLSDFWVTGRIGGIPNL